MTEPGARPEPSSVVPTCYRHPGRETYIRCTRCERPICPDCMTSAAVGFQCPECVAEGRATQRAPQTVFGGRVHAQQDIVTRVLIGMNLAVYVLQIVVPSLTNHLASNPLLVAQGQWWRLATAGFVHFSITHILFNMVSLWALGRQLEGVLGRARFISLYVISLLAGSAVSYVFASPNSLSGGASGAIFGLFGAYFVVCHRMRWDLRPFIGLLLINVLLTVLSPSIDWHAHVGGAIAGAIFTAAFAYPPRAWATRTGIAAGILLVAVSVGMVVAHTNELRSDPVLGPVIVSGTISTGNDTRVFP